MRNGLRLQRGTATKPSPAGDAGKRLATLFALVLLAVLLPLAGAYVAGRPIEPYLQLSRRPPFPAPSSFEWPAFLIYALIILAVVGPFVWRIATVRPLPRGVREHRFPWWGWAGFAITVIAWVVAWSRFTELKLVQPYTFTPLWIGYVLVVSGLVHRRTGHSLLRSRPACFALLIPASAGFWWLFEYLNRYAGNWYYVGVELVPPLEYFVHASVAFATVLPAVASTRDWYASFRRLQAAFTGFLRVPFADSRPLAWTLLALGAAGFFMLGIWPHQVYSLVWVAPLLVLVSLQALTGQPNLLSDIRHGDWRSTALPAVAALTTGFFWEMWNWKSLVHWEYSIPLVDGFQLFEMPILGYAGYIPFGMVCVITAALVCGRERRTR